MLPLGALAAGFGLLGASAFAQAQAQVQAQMQAQPLAPAASASAAALASPGARNETTLQPISVSEPGVPL